MEIIQEDEEEAIEKQHKNIKKIDARGMARKKQSPPTRQQNVKKRSMSPKRVASSDVDSEEEEKTIKLPLINQQQKGKILSSKEQVKVVKSIKVDPNVMFKSGLGGNKARSVSPKSTTSESISTANTTLITESDLQTGTEQQYVKMPKLKKGLKNMNIKIEGGKIKEQEPVLPETGKVKQKPSKKDSKQLKSQQLTKEQKIRMRKRQQMEDEIMVKSKLDERKRKEQEEEVNKKDKERLQQEKPEVKAFRQTFTQTLTKINMEKTQQMAWNNVLSCSAYPDVNNQNELNNFLYYVKMLPITLSNTEEILDLVQMGYDILAQIQVKYLNALAELNAEEQKLSQEQIEDYFVMLQKKIEEVAFFMGMHSDVFFFDVKQNELKEKGLKVNLYAGRTERRLFNKVTARATALDQDNAKPILDKFEFDAIKEMPKRKDFLLGLWVNPVAKKVRYKPIELHKLGISCEIPRTLMNLKLVMKVHWQSTDCYCKTYQKNISVGGVLNIEFLEFLPMPKKRTGNYQFTLRYEYPEDFVWKKYAYPNYEANLTQQNYNFRVQYPLPETLYISDPNQVKIALWDKYNGWISEFIEDTKINVQDEIRKVSFNTLRLAPFTLVQSRCLDFPYVNWRLRCINHNTAILDIQTKRLFFQFVIGEEYVIMKGQERPELMHLQDKKFGPEQILYELAKSGVYLFPHENDAYVLQIPAKVQKAEKFSIETIMYAIRSYHIKSSPWNLQGPIEKIFFQMRENLEYEQDIIPEDDIESDWLQIAAYKNKIGVVQHTSAVKNESLKENTQTHTCLKILLMKHNLASSQEVVKRIDDLENSEIMMVTVKHFLTLTKLLSFT